METGVGRSAALRMHVRGTDSSQTQKLRGTGGMRKEDTGMWNYQEALD